MEQALTECAMTRDSAFQTHLKREQIGARAIQGGIEGVEVGRKQAGSAYNEVARVARRDSVVSSARKRLELTKTWVADQQHGRKGYEHNAAGQGSHTRRRYGMRAVPKDACVRGGGGACDQREGGCISSLCKAMQTTCNCHKCDRLQPKGGH